MPRVIQGSVAQRVAKKCRIPVTIIKEQADGDDPARADTRVSWNPANLLLEAGKAAKAATMG